MYGFLLFLHLTGLFVWIGAVLAIVVMLLMLKKQLGSLESNLLAKRVIRVFSWLAHPGSLVVLVSGVLMIIQMGLGEDKPLWLDVMEKGGGTIILLALVLTGVLGGRIRKRLGVVQNQKIRLSGYLTTMTTLVVLVLSVVLIVSMKI